MNYHKKEVDVRAIYSPTGKRWPIPEEMLYRGPDGAERWLQVEVRSVNEGYEEKIAVAGLVYRVRIPVGKGRLHETNLYYEPVPGDRFGGTWLVAEKQERSEVSTL